MRNLIMFIIFGILVSAALAFGAAPTKVTYDQYNRVLKNGKPWFPILLTPVPPPFGAKDPMGRDAVESLVADGVDGFRIGRGLETKKEQDECAKYLDWFAKYGAYAMPYISEPSVFSAKFPKRPEVLRQIIERFKDHPALALWKTMDEPAWGGSSPQGMIEAYKFIKKIDQDHPVWIGHAPRATLETLREYYDACDMAGLDIYPISIPMGKHGHFPNKEMSVVGDYAQWINKALYGKKPFFMILQICWSGVTPPNNILVMPTYRQERYMTYQSIINGARGLVYFGMPVALQGRDAELGYNWTFWNEVMRPLLREMGKGSEIHSALLAPDARAALKVSGQPELEYTTRQVGPFLYIFAAKREGPAKEIRFTGDVLSGEIEALSENRKLNAQNGSFSDNFEPFDVHIYKVRLR